MRVPFVDLRVQYLSIKPEIDAAIVEVLSNTAFIGGRPVSLFEQAFAAWVNAQHCLSVANGTDAIEIALRALGVGEGDEVVVPANSFIATSEAVTSVGARVVFADSRPDDYTIDPDDIRRKISSRTKAIIPVHLYGQPADMDAIMEIAREHGLFVLEDTSQAHGALYKGRCVGSIGDAGTFSFYPGKNLGAYGDGGAIVFRDGEVALRARTYANHGSLVKYHHLVEGRNSRLDGLQAAILSVKLRHIDRWNDMRRRNAELYSKLLADLDGVVLPTSVDETTSVWHLYVIRCKDRDALAERLAAQGIATGIHYPISLPMLEAYRYLGHSKDDFPVANSQMDELLSLPMYPELTEEMIVHTATVLRQEVTALAGGLPVMAH